MIIIIIKIIMRVIITITVILIIMTMIRFPRSSDQFFLMPTQSSWITALLSIIT